MIQQLNSLESSRNGGSTQRQSSLHEASVRVLKRRCALVVDDEQDSREALAILLNWAEYEVHGASNGDDALTVAAQYLPELILLDIGMPGISGYDVCRRLRTSSAFQQARIFALSGFSGELHDTRCSEAGFTGKLTKPLDPVALGELIGLSPTHPSSRS